MNYNFTDRVRKVLAMAREEAVRLQHDYVGTEHILLGLIREGEGVAAEVLTEPGGRPRRPVAARRGEHPGRKGDDADRRTPVYDPGQEGARVRDGRVTRVESQLRGNGAPAARSTARRTWSGGQGAWRTGDRGRRGAGRDAQAARDGHACRTARDRTSDASAREREQVEDSCSRSFLPRPHGTRRRRQTRSDDRARGRNRASHGGAVSA